MGYPPSCGVLFICQSEAVQLIYLVGFKFIWSEYGVMSEVMSLNKICAIFLFRLMSKFDLRRVCKAVGATALPKIVS